MTLHPFFLCPFSVPALSLFTPITTTYLMLLVSSTPLLNIFLEHTLHILPSSRQRTWHAHSCRTLLFKKGLTFFSERGRYTRETSDSIIAVMGNRIKCELAGVVHSWTYSCFEALKVRDPRLEPVPHYRYYEDIRVF